MKRVELIDGVWTYTWPIHQDDRGSLMAGQVGEYLPFIPKRLFFVSDVPQNRQRGDHAHKQCHQLLVCLQGRIDCIVDNGWQRAEICLNPIGAALYMPPMIWGTQKRYDGNAILMVIASHEYDTDDYVRDYSEFLELIQSTSAIDKSTEK